MGYTGFFVIILLLFAAYFWFRVDEIKKGTGISTNEAVRKGLKSLLSLVISFIIVILLFLGYTYYRIL